MTADLHLHSYFSDGSWSPEEVAQRAKRAGLSAFALTDHDTTDGLSEAARAAEKLGLQFIPGIELAASTGEEEDEVHILGYFLRADAPGFQDRLTNLRKMRFQRAERMVEKLARLGMKLDWERLRREARHSALGRPHLARALTKAGFTRTPQEAFDRWLGEGRPAFVPKTKFQAEEAVELIRSAGGIPILAHPTWGADSQKKFRELAKRGIRGAEVYHPQTDSEKARDYLEWARELHWLVTGGSDCHGEGLGDGPKIGKVRLPLEYLQKLQQASGDKF